MELEKRVEQLEREVAALEKKIADMPYTIGKAVLEAAKNKENTSPIGGSGVGTSGCSYKEFTDAQKSRASMNP